MKKIFRLGRWKVIKRHTSKSGYNQETRKCLYCGTIATSQSGGPMHECYDRNIKK